jgi:hypothetical protein
MATMAIPDGRKLNCFVGLARNLENGFTIMFQMKNWLTNSIIRSIDMATFDVAEVRYLGRDACDRN